jgi:hypothetical protein
VGFTAGTGEGFENQDVVDWTYSNTFDPINSLRYLSLADLTNGDVRSNVRSLRPANFAVDEGAAVQAGSSL